MSSWTTNLWSNFYDPQWKLICCNKWHPGTLEISTLAEIAVGTHFHVQHGTKTTPVLLPADGEGSWSLISSSLKPGGKLSFLEGLNPPRTLTLKKIQHWKNNEYKTETDTFKEALPEEFVWIPETGVFSFLSRFNLNIKEIKSIHLKIKCETLGYFLFCLSPKHYFETLTKTRKLVLSEKKAKKTCSKFIIYQKLEAKCPLFSKKKITGILEVVLKFQ